MFSISKGKGTWVKENEEDGFLGSLILKVISQTEMCHPSLFFKSRNLGLVLSRSLHYFSWNLKRKLFLCVCEKEIECIYLPLTPASSLGFCDYNQ